MCVTNEMSQDGKTVCTYGPLGHVTATNSRQFNSYKQVKSSSLEFTQYHYGVRDILNTVNTFLIARFIAPKNSETMMIFH